MLMVVAHLVGCPSVAPHVAGSEHVAHPRQFSGAKLLLRMLLGAQPKAQTLVFEFHLIKRHSATLRPHVDRQPYCEGRSYQNSEKTIDIWSADSGV
jgi:hypothetical protein